MDFRGAARVDFSRVWIDLGGDVCLHGTSPNGTTDGLGCISLSPIDSADGLVVNDRRLGVLRLDATTQPPDPQPLGP